ncbi:Fc receptor-like protein 5 [Perca fluviatilis]|uniref:Fc receptor-like protein 5 n=1 Tax=Perca fluviatilis TaxID=8168 RepID=UPI001962F844|nr:Fc receptor-like protein 5 [Perca fluviatilis]
MMQLGNPQKYQENNTCVISQDSDKGHIIVDEVEPEGKYVRLCNNSKRIKKWKTGNYIYTSTTKTHHLHISEFIETQGGECVKRLLNASSIDVGYIRGAQIISSILMLEFTLLNSYTQTIDAAFLCISPNRQQHFEYESLSFKCEGTSGSTQLRGTWNSEEFKPICDVKKTPTGSSCTIDKIYQGDSGEYWCETEEGVRSNTVKISVTAGSVILESPVLPLMEGETVTLRCRNKTSSTNLPADFYKDGRLMKSSSGEEMTIKVSKSDEGLYKCSISGAGESPESWLAVRAGPVILESPVLPVKEGNNVTLSCRKKTTTLNLPADFYKDGRLISSSSSTGEMTIHSVSKSDEGLYKCSISGAGESPESWLAVRAPHRETCPCSNHFIYVLLILRTVFTIVMVALLLLLVGLLHSGQLRVKHK